MIVCDGQSTENVDHGKTTLLDRIRGTAVTKGEAGGITQHIGASEIPTDTIKKFCGELLEKMGVELTIPGLLIIDTPGHAAFTTLRKRGGAISDIAVLVIDINEGLQPQTEECIRFLKEFKTPFIIAATKVDRLLGWTRSENKCFSESIKEQPERVQEELEKKIYNLIGQISVHGFEAERHDRVSDFAKQIAIVPVSGITGEGVQDLLVMLAGLAQRYLKDRIVFTKGEGKGTVLEVKEHKGMGLTIDVILYDGEIRIGDNLVIGGEEIIVTKVKALLKPEPLKEMCAEKRFKTLDSVAAASGIKISAPGLEGVIAGSPVRAVRNQGGVEKAKEEIRKEIEEVEIETQKEGVLVKADTLGSLEAMVKSLKGLEIPVRKAEVGSVTKQDVMEINKMKEPIIFAFNVQTIPEAGTLAKDYGVVIFSSNIIYRLLEDYEKWKEEQKKLSEKQMLATVTRPCRMRVLPGCVFRQSKPAVFGVEIQAGFLKPGFKLKVGDKVVGRVKEIQLQGKNVDEAKTGDKVALSMEGVVVGKHVKVGDVLETNLRPQDLRILERIKDKLTDDEKQLLEELEKAKL